MLTIISCAKMFRKEADLSTIAQAHCCTAARFVEHSYRIAQALAQCPSESLQKQLKIKSPVASELLAAMQNFDAKKGHPAMLAYHGVAFKSLAPELYSAEDWAQAQQSMRICSFLYGLLRPLDAIDNYRLEGTFKLSDKKGDTVFKSWQDELTNSLIADTRAMGGTLCMLASKEMQKLFDWQRVSEEVHLITPDFLIEEKGKRRVCSVRSKQARGAMASAILKNRWSNIADLQQWGHEEGYELREQDEHKLLFVKNID